jgi:hypothetical protein
MKKVFWAVLLSLCVCGVAKVSVASYIYGYVYDSNENALENVKVSTKDDYKNYETTTYNNGYYDLSGLGIGTYTVKYEKGGYQTQSLDVVFETDYEEIQLKKTIMVSNPIPTPSPIPSLTPIATLTPPPIPSPIIFPTPSPTATPTKEFDVTGTWEGYFSSSLTSTDITMKLKQSNNIIKGRVKGSYGFRGKVRGKLSENTIKFTIIETTRNCGGSFKGTATINGSGDEMDFTFTGKDCSGIHKDGEGIIYLSD